MADTFLINNIKATIISDSGQLTGKASISANKMQIVMDGTQLEDFTKNIVNQELRTETNVAFIKGLVMEVLVEQNLL